MTSFAFHRAEEAYMTRHYKALVSYDGVDLEYEPLRLRRRG